MNTDARYWQDLQSLFHLLQNLAPQNRERVLAERRPDPDLRQRVCALLQAADDEGRACALGPAPPNEKKVPRIGPYFLVQRLGSGGSGTVYLVERDVVGIPQKAALKILSPAVVGSSFVDRFRREQRILASLDHPNIVRMLDAGFDQEARPYLVMEYVAGRQLDKFCDERKLTIEDRLGLFLKVCDAVAYAHRRLVVHLDLKPSNILVTSDSMPKLLDFGTSKLFEAESRLTTTRPLTPSYASPEHLRDEPVTTACDVYSLGVILYELLAGRRPAGESSLAVLIESAVEEREPPPLTHIVTPEAARNRGVPESRLRSLLGSDLSTIVRKCLRPRPHERYASVGTLAEDIERYLAGKPVLAQKQNTVYYLKKFLRRNKSKVLTLSLLLFAVAASVVYALVQQQRAIQEGSRAARTQTFMSQLFRLANSNATGKQVSTVSDFLSTGTKLAPLLVHDKRQLAEVECSLADSLRDSGNTAASTPVYERALADARAAGDVDTEAKALAGLAPQYMDNGLTEKAIAVARGAINRSNSSAASGKSKAYAALALGYVLVLAQPDNPEGVRSMEQAARFARTYDLPLYDRASIIGNLAWAASIRGHLPEAEQAANESLAIYHNLPVEMCDSALPAIGLAHVYRSQKRFAEAEKMLRANYLHVSNCLGSGFDLSLAVLGQWGYALVFTGQINEAIQRLESGLVLARKTYAGRNASYLVDLLAPLSLAYNGAGHLPQAESTCLEILAVLQAERANPYVAQAQSTLGKVLVSQHRFAAALPYLEAAYHAYAQHAPNSPFAQGLPDLIRQAQAQIASQRGGLAARP